MRKEGPLILVEDDSDDQELMLHVFEDLGLKNEVQIFRNGKEALDYLYQTRDKPFLIISDINMPVIDGITFKKKIDGCPLLKERRIPFVFMSTAPAPFVSQINDLSIQGCFEKGYSLSELNETLKTILKYWDLTKHLN
jgi:CheY-like chemotaxis protein